MSDSSMIFWFVLGLPYGLGVGLRILCNYMILVTVRIFPVVVHMLFYMRHWSNPNSRAEYSVSRICFFDLDLADSWVVPFVVRVLWVPSIGVRTSLVFHPFLGDSLREFLDPQLLRTFALGFRGSLLCVHVPVLLSKVLVRC
jgi:hypothetical protein